MFLAPITVVIAATETIVAIAVAIIAVMVPVTVVAIVVVAPPIVTIPIVDLVPAALALIVQVAPAVICLVAVIAVVFDGVPQSRFCPFNPKLARPSILGLGFRRCRKKTECAEGCGNCYFLSVSCQLRLCVHRGFSSISPAILD